MMVQRLQRGILVLYSILNYEDTFQQFPKVLRSNSCVFELLVHSRQVVEGHELGVIGSCVVCAGKRGAPDVLIRFLLRYDSSGFLPG